MHFEILGEITEVETFASGSGIREVALRAWTLAQAQGYRTSAIIRWLYPSR
jgi:hypothetical protein